jgi:non-heme chloroperoxidase
MHHLRRIRLVGVLLVVAASVSPAQNSSAPPVRTLRANGVVLSYREQGKGTPVVFIHGAVGDLRFWEPQRVAFSRGHRFVSYSLRYHGTGAWPDSTREYSVAAHVADLVALVRALNAGPVHLVGLSYGGTVAAVMAAEHPELVRSVVLAEPGLFHLMVDVPEGQKVMEEVVGAFAAFAQPIQAGDHMQAVRLLTDWVSGSTGAYDRLPADLRQILNDNARTLPLVVASPPMPEFNCASLKTIKAPALVLTGANSPRQFSLTNERVVACLRGSRAAVIPDAGHVMSYDNARAFNETVLGFIAGK